MTGPFTAVDPTLIFAGLDLLGYNEHEGAEFVYETLSDDWTWGNPQPVDIQLTSQVRDGSVTRTQRYDNREVYLRIKVRAADATGLQAGEDALAQVCGMPTTLEWTPPDGAAATTVFKVETSHLQHLADDLEERRTTRYYGLRIIAAPFTRSVDRVTVTATPDGVSFSETVIDEATSTTGWTASHPPVTLVSGQAVRTTYFGPPLYTLWLERAGSVTLTDPYIRVKAAKTKGDLVLIVDGVTYTAVASGSGQWWFEVPAGTYSTIRVSNTYEGGRAPSKTYTLTVWSLYQTNTAGFGSRRELSRTFTDIPGSARAPGDLVVSHPTTGLGDVLVYVYPDGDNYSPSLQSWRTSGGALTSDSGTVSGKREPLNGTPTFVVPSVNVPPAAYHIVARIRHTSTASFQVTYTAEIAGTTITRTATVAMAVANTWQNVILGTEHLPPVRVTDTSDRDVTVTLTTATSGVEFDAGWLFRANELDYPSALIQVAAGSELTVTYQSADVDSPSELIFVGDHFAANFGSLESPQMQPPSVRVYLVTSGTNDAEVAFDYYPHWYGHAGS